MEPHPHHIQYRSLILTFFLAVCVIIIGVVYRYQENGFFSNPTNDEVSSARPTEPPTPAVFPKAAVTTVKIEAAITSTPMPSDTPTVTPTQGQPPNLSTQFVLTADKRAGAVGESITLNLVASSAGKKPVGYDAIITISGGQYDVVSVRSLSPMFTTMKFVKSDRVTITGILAPRYTEADVWSNVTIAEIVIRPKMAGRYELKIAETSGRETSKIMIKNESGETEKLFSAPSEPVVVDIAQ